VKEEEDNEEKDEEKGEAPKPSKKRKNPKRLDPVLSDPLTNWRSPCGLGTSKRSRQTMSSILAGLTKRDEELEEKSKAWEQEKIEIKKVKEEAIPDTRIIGRTVPSGNNDDEDFVDPASLVEELFEDADTVVIFTKRLFMKNLYQVADTSQRKQHTQFQQQQRNKINKINPSTSPHPTPNNNNNNHKVEQKVSPDKLNVAQAFFKALQTATPTATTKNN